MNSESVNMEFDYRPSLLLVEDCDLIRSTVFLTLNKDFDILTVANAEKALKISREMSKIEVLITDYNLNDHHGRTGISVAKEFRIFHPSSPIILMTGDANTDCLIDLLQAVKGELLEKPFTPDELLKILNIN